MSKNKLSELKNRRTLADTRGEAPANKSDAWFSPAAIRETVESVIIAFVLAFLFRTFEAEAFVIPTGSMAPTLMGKHKDLECPKCHYRYHVSASDHNDLETAIYHGTCPMCRFTADLAPNNPQHKSYPSFDGDRILVAKFPYEFADPKRWDVIVFKYPNNATMNYIKRLVGLPGETIKIHDGDLWIHKPTDPDPDHFEIARKPPEKILAMLQPVYDNDLAPTITGSMHWPPRWAPEAAPGGHAWTNAKENSTGPEDLSSFQIDGSGKGPNWIRYRHRVPTPEEWLAAETDPKGANNDSVLPQLITDFTAYNTGQSDQSANRVPLSLMERGYGQHWVGDLAVQFELESKSASGKVVADLVKGGRHFQCRFDLSNGNAELAISGGGPEADGYHRIAKTPVVGSGRHTIIFANVDSELTLWVGPPHDAWTGSLQVVPFKDPAQAAAQPPQEVKAGSESEKHPNRYDCRRLDNRIPTAEDLSPVGIAAEEASVKISHIKVLRDVYYIAMFNGGKSQGASRLQDFKSEPDLNYPENWDYLSDPRTWPSVFNDDNMKKCTVKIKAPDPAHPEKDRFFVLGDNSAQSSDGRLWEGEWWVDRELLIGKALFIYWPHGWPIPYLGLPVNPIPDFQRMHLVR